MQHRSLNDKYMRGQITGHNFVRDESGRVADIGKWHGEGSTLHGTQIASIIGGCAFTKSDVNGTTDYPAGIAPDADLYLCRAVDFKEINPFMGKDAISHHTWHHRYYILRNSQLVHDHDDKSVCVKDDDSVNSHH